VTVRGQNAGMPTEAYACSSPMTSASAAGRFSAELLQLLSVNERTGSAAAVQRPLIHKSVELGGILADDLVAGGCGQMAELFLDVFLGIRPDAVRVREV